MAPKACLGQQRGARWPKCVPKWVPIWGPIFNIFRYFLIHFCALFSRLRFGSYLLRCSLNLGVILESFLQLFRASLKCAGKGSRSSPSLSEHYLEAPVFTLFRIIFRTSVPTPVFLTFSPILASILASILEPKSQKVVTKKASKNRPAKKSCKKFKSQAGAATTPPCPPLKEQSQDWQQGQGIRDTPLVPSGTVVD